MKMPWKKRCVSAGSTAWCKRMDEEKYAQKFTPRQKNSTWSALNKRRIVKLIHEGRT